METGTQELLTGDTNLVNVNLSVHYRIKNAADYVLNMTDVRQLIDSSATTSIRQIVSENSIDYVLTEGKENIEREALELLSNTMTRNKTGIEIVSVQLVQADPPASVMASFQDLATARQDKSIYINEAIAYQNTIIPQANAEAYEAVSEAEAYREEKIQTAEGDAEFFIMRQAAYAESKEVTSFRLYMEAMDEILPNVQKLLLGTNVSIDNAELWLTSPQN